MGEIAVLKTQLIRCQQAMSSGACNIQNGIEWLNNFCGDFYIYAQHLHKYIGAVVEEDLAQNQDVETILLCLAQICLCTKYLEQVLKAENMAGKAIIPSRKHFIERINWCLGRLRTAYITRTSNIKPATSNHMVTGFPFMSLYDMLMDKLHAYSSYQNENVQTNAGDNIAQAHFTSNELQSTLRIMISNALALANVAPMADKTALSALCQKVLRECNAFQQECTLHLKQIKSNIWDRRLKAIALETALTQLQQYVGDTICRLIFIAFVDLEKFSLDNLRAKLHQNGGGDGGNDDADLDEFIADFDVNLDRLTQIGLFCADIAYNTKLQTFLRSIIASLEALDACIIPSVQSCQHDSIHAEILEQHFTEEITKLKKAIFESVNFKPLTNCYYEMLNQCVTKIEKEFNKSKLWDLVQMGEFLLQFWQYPNNRKQLTNDQNDDKLKYFRQFRLMLHECRAILVCADQVDQMRIIKRFKILRIVTRKFLDALNKTANTQGDDVDGQAHGGEKKKARFDKKLMSVVAGETHTIDANQTPLTMDTIEASVSSIFYRKDSAIQQRRRKPTKMSESLWGNSSKLPLKELQEKQHVGKSYTATEGKANERQQYQQFRTNRSSSVGCSVRRKESLRTEMFKRQKSLEMSKACDFYLQNSASLEISEILDQLTQISVNKSSSDREEKLLNSTLLL